MCGVSHPRARYISYPPAVVLVTPVLLIVVIVSLNAAGDYFLKLASERDGALATFEFAGGVGCYALSAIGVLYAFRIMPVSILGIWYALLSVLFLVGLGTLVFGERLQPRELLGLALALAALVLMRRLA